MAVELHNQIGWTLSGQQTETGWQSVYVSGELAGRSMNKPGAALLLTRSLSEAELAEVLKVLDERDNVACVNRQVVEPPPPVSYYEDQQ